MKHLICEHLKQGTKGSSNVLFLTKGDKRVLACDECCDVSGCLFGTVFDVSERYFNILRQEIAALARPQTVN